MRVRPSIHTVELSRKLVDHTTCNHTIIMALTLFDLKYETIQKARRVIMTLSRSSGSTNIQRKL
eukprot:scaffold25665_cov113-Cylindrotheca_fusiformis.AAC.7